MAHGLGKFILWLMVIGIFITSAVMSYTFFSSIAPPGKPWFAWFMLSLTEVGLAGWLAVFKLTNHNAIAKVIALVMIALSLLAVVVTDAMQLTIMMSDHGLIVRNPWLIQTAYYIFIVMFCAHFIALIADMFASYFAVHPFRDSYAVPKNVSQHYAPHSLAQTAEIAEIDAPKNDAPLKNASRPASRKRR